MGLTYYDSEGEAKFINGVPINAVKKATFRDKLGTLHTLLKMVYNSVTYDFTKTARGGAVIFANNYKKWEFIAPDDRLDFAGYSDMTLGEALSAMRTTLVANPISAWDNFAAWVYDMNDYPKYVISNNLAYISPIGGNYTQISPPDFRSMAGRDFVNFLDVLIAAVGTSDLAMSDFKDSDTGFSCAIDVRNKTGGSTFIGMTFTFRE